MAAKKPKALKVYRTAIGFHDAYVAAASKKAALAAWGTTKDLFARGAAELVDDPKLAAEPLAHPGEVIRRVRGTATEQIAALPSDERKRPRSKNAKSAAPKATPKPSRAKIEQAEERLAEAERRQDADMAALRREEELLAKRRRELSDAHGEETAKLRADIEAAQDDHDAAMRAWRNG